jgi:hypothetical protein
MGVADLGGSVVEVGVGGIAATSAGVVVADDTPLSGEESGSAPAAVTDTGEATSTAASGVDSTPTAHFTSGISLCVDPDEWPSSASDVA